MNDLERSELTDLAVAYRQLFAAILDRAFEDLHKPKYRQEARQFFLSGRANAFIILLDLDPTTFITKVLNAPRRRPPYTPVYDSETGDEERVL